MDTYFERGKCIDRLCREYRKHRSLIVAVDFDDTIFDFHEQGNSHKQMITLLRECNEVGMEFIIWTASPPERWQRVKEQFAMIVGFQATAINENSKYLPFGRWGKIYYNILLDDRSGLLEAYLILKEVVDRIKQSKMV